MSQNNNGKDPLADYYAQIGQNTQENNPYEYLMNASSDTRRAFPDLRDVAKSVDSTTRIMLDNCSIPNKNEDSSNE